jgi:chemotaxis signal transduction protein
MEMPAGTMEALEILVADTWYAINLAPVREVIPILRCDPLQESPDWIIGTFQYEDDTVPVVDTNFRLNGERTVLRPTLKIVLVDALRLTGLVVSDVGDIITFNRERVVPVSSGIPHADHLIGALPKTDGTSVHLLSVESLSRVVEGESHQDG